MPKSGFFTLSRVDTIIYCFYSRFRWKQGMEMDAELDTEMGTEMGTELRTEMGGG